MALHWTVTLQCSECGARIRYEDERPPWLDDDEVIQQIAAAEAFVREHPTGPAFADRPPYVRWELFGGRHFVEPPDHRYVECPSCGGKAYRGSGSPAAGDVENEDLSESEVAAT